MSPTGDFARCPICGIYGLHGCLGPNPVPAPEQQGEPLANRIARQAAEDANRAKRLYGPTGEPDEQGEPVCANCGHPIDTIDTCHLCGWPVPPSAPPSSEEAEALPTRSRLWAAFMEVVSGDARDPDEAIDGFSTALKDHEAAIRAPLEERLKAQETAHASTESWTHNKYMHEKFRAEAAEERIRELEAEVSSWSTQAETSEEEAERLREALRETATHLNMASLVVDTALLPSPPSSTEGTKEVEG